MDEIQTVKKPHQHHWRNANTKLFPSAVLAIIGIIICTAHGGLHHGNAGHKFVAVLGLLLFIFFAIAFLQVLTKSIYRVLAYYHLGPGRAAAFQFVMRLVGYITVSLIILDLLGIPVGKLLLGGAALGIILGVAAQQALANFFASIVLIISHPFSVGQYITITSGGLGGKYIGQVKDIGLTHTKLKDDDGNIVMLPNATLLSGATIMPGKVEPK